MNGGAVALAATALVAVAALLAALRARAALAATVRAQAERERAAGAEAQASRRTGALLQALIDSTPFAIVLFGEDGDIEFANPSARQLFFDGASIAGLNFLAMLERAPAPLRRALAADDDELVAVEKDGEGETFYVSKRRFDSEGRPYVLVAVKAVTEVLARKEIATLKNVIRIIAHEANNSLAPIASLMSSARVILTKPEHAGRLPGILDTVEDRARHLQKFLAGYSALAKLPPPQRAPTPWEPLLAELRALWPAADVGAAPPAPGYFDRGQIQQALINLVKNAVEAGGPPGEVRVQLEQPPEGGVRVSVLDRGPGMSEEVMSQALLPFFTTKAGGSGIGLALCREIVEQHRGRLRIARREGGGMAISFWLPDRDTPLNRLPAESRVRFGLTRS